ncbi:MAG: glycine cleavage system protein GcvH [Myxococcota bacterium]
MSDYDIPQDLRYSAEDEWARADDGRVVIGVTDFAQQQLGDIVFVELPKVGERITKGDAFGVIESVKAVSDLFAPVSGEVVELNGQLEDAPEVVNADCYGDGWILAVEGTDDADLAELMDADAYRAHVAEREED